MKIVISGAGGFLGTHLIRELLAETEDTLVALTSKPDRLAASGRLLPVHRDAFRTIDWATVDVLVNCAFPRNADGASLAAGMEYVSALLRSAVQGGVHSVINISSQSVYSQCREKPASEEDELSLESKYAVGKYASELLTEGLCSALPHTSLRMASLIGAHFDQRLVNKFVLQALGGQDLNITGGSQIFGFLDVRDAASGILSVLKARPSAWKPVYNLGTEEAYTLAHIAKTVCAMSGEFGERSIEFHLEPSEAAQNTSMNCSRMYEDFGWKARYRLADSVKWIYEESVSARKEEM